MIKKVSYKDQVYEYLKTAIIKDEIKVGEIYSEQQIADTLSVSRTPVREAVIRLANEGIVEVRSNRGWSVRPVTPEDMRAIIEARIAIEGYCVRELARSKGQPGWDERIARLTACQEHSESIAHDETRSYEYMQADTEFHCLVVACTDNPYLTRINDQMRAKIEQATFTTLHISRRSAAACTEHGAILAAIKTGDEAAAMSAFRAHMDSTAKALGTTIPE